MNTTENGLDRTIFTNTFHIIFYFRKVVVWNKIAGFKIIRKNLVKIIYNENQKNVEYLYRMTLFSQGSNT